MKNVIIYGVRGIRKEIEANLSDDYNIIGYSDSDTIYKHISEYEYKPFYTPFILCDQLFDYVIITVSNKTVSAQIVIFLINAGILQEKIIETCYVINSVYLFDIPLKNYIKLNQTFDGLCFGMSYTYNAFLTHYFSKRFYKLSYFGADMYFHYMNILYLAKHHIDLLSNIKYIVFDLPYYTFNWDLSKAKYTIRNRFSLLEPFNDYHNYGINDLEEWNIQEYQILKKMFYPTSRTNSSSCSNNFEPHYINNFYIQEDNFASLEHVWTSLHNDTIHENKDLFSKILSLLKSINPQIKFAIIITPMLLEYLKENLSEINHMKDLFYNIISGFCNEYNISVVDCYDMFQDKSFYFDVHHLNAQGGYDFSIYLDSVFKESLY